MKRFDPTATAMESLSRKVEELPAIQARLVERHPQLQHADRVAHHQQIAAGPVELTIVAAPPEDVRGIGLFDPAAVHKGIGRISNGLGCPHLETDPDFLGIMLAFRACGRRIDFLGINDPTAPTDTVEEFMALLAATAESAGVEIPFGAVGELDLGNLTAAQLTMFNTLEKRLGFKRATHVYAHVARQTSRTLLSSTAYQPYWTGVVRLGDALGKFALAPTEDLNRHRSIRPGERYLTEDWRRRNADRALSFRLYWIPYVNEGATPTKRLTDEWSEEHRVEVGNVVFPRTDPDTPRAKLFAILASEMGANPGNWVADRAPAPADSTVPSTEFAAARFLAYRASQNGRSALPESTYESVFDSAEITPELEVELARRYRANRASGHVGLDLGELE
jgi:hypothetical protein